MPKKYVEVEVHYQLDYSDVMDWIEWDATDSQKLAIFDAVAGHDEDEEFTEAGQIVPNPGAYIMEQLAIKEMNEFLRMHGAEEAMNLIKKGKEVAA